MSQVPVKWCRTDLMTDHQLHYANGDPMGKQIPVVPLDALREVVEGLQKQYRGEACYIYKEALNDLLASLGEQ